MTEQHHFINTEDSYKIHTKIDWFSFNYKKKLTKFIVIISTSYLIFRKKKRGNNLQKLASWLSGSLLGLGRYSALWNGHCGASVIDSLWFRLHNNCRVHLWLLHETGRWHNALIDLMAPMNWHACLINILLHFVDLTLEILLSAVVLVEVDRLTLRHGSSSRLSDTSLLPGGDRCRRFWWGHVLTIKRIPRLYWCFGSIILFIILNSFK